MLTLTILAGLGSLAASPAAAQRRRTDAPSEEQTRALTLFEQSATAYREGRFGDAASMLREAYRLHPEPVLLYNLARALDAEGDLDGALDAYQRFLAAQPDADQAPLATRRVEVLQEQIAERDEADAAAAAADPTTTETAPPPSDTAPPPPPPAASSSGPDLLGPGLALGASALVAVVGGILVGSAVARHDQAVNEPVQLTAVGFEHDATTLRDAGVAVLVIGGVAVAATTIWLAVAASSHPEQPSTALRFGPGSISLHGTF